MRIKFAHGNLGNNDVGTVVMMRTRQSKKRAVNLFVDVELLDEARRMNINISESLEQRLRSIIRAERERRWLEENREAIAQYNRRVAEHGLLSDDAGLL
jgi:antitoxin CcdA